jgi:hypothetical protein
VFALNAACQCFIIQYAWNESKLVPRNLDPSKSMPSSRRTNKPLN